MAGPLDGSEEGMDDEYVGVGGSTAGGASAPPPPPLPPGDDDEGAAEGAASPIAKSATGA